jgi:hypothetical protein
VIVTFGWRERHTTRCECEHVSRFVSTVSVLRFERDLGS